MAGIYWVEADVPAYEATLWLNLAAPPGTPADIVQRLATETAKALQDQEPRHGFRAAGVEATYLSPQELATFMRAEHDRWDRAPQSTDKRAPESASRLV